MDNHIEDNKLIAEYIGLRRGWWISQEKPLTEDKKQWWDVDSKTFLKSDRIYYDNELLFHTSWDWLKPVIDMIYEATDDDVKQFAGQPIFEYGLGASLEEAYKAVVQFIKWYNDWKLK